MTLPDRGRTAVLCSAFALALTLSACGDDSSPLDEAQDDSAAQERAKDEKAVEETYLKYWDVVVQTENAGEGGPEDFEGIAEDNAVEGQLRRVTEQADQDILRVGEPTISRVTPSVSGDTATVVACLNEDEWSAEENGEPIESEPFGDSPVGASLERRGERWVVTEIMQSDDAATTEDCA